MFKQIRILRFHFLNFLILLTFVAGLIQPPAVRAQSAGFSLSQLPQPGTLVTLSTPYTPAVIRGMSLYADNPLKFDFIVSAGDDNLEGQTFEQESEKLIKYFLSALTIADEEMWVNLSPYEENRIMSDGMKGTALGRDMLAQDYLLKQLSASMVYPEDDFGRKFWEKVYAKAQAIYGTTEIPMSTFNKIWIMPDKASVYVHENNVFVVDMHLKVMLEEDYLFLESNQNRTNHGVGAIAQDQTKEISDVSSSIIREVLLPEVEKEINQGRHFANLRQIVYSMILATWYKTNLKNSVLGQAYAGRNKLDGVTVEDENIEEKIYAMYVKALEKGVYDYIKEEYDETADEMIPRKYFSGGVRYPAELVARQISGEGSLDPEKIEKLSKKLEKNPHQLVQSLLDYTVEGHSFRHGNGAEVMNRITQKVLKFSDEKYGELSLQSKTSLLIDAVRSANDKRITLSEEEYLYIDDEGVFHVVSPEFDFVDAEAHTGEGSLYGVEVSYAKDRKTDESHETPEINKKLALAVEMGLLTPEEAAAIKSGRHSEQTLRRKLDEMDTLTSHWELKPFETPEEVILKRRNKIIEFHNAAEEYALRRQFQTALISDKNAEIRESWAHPESGTPTVMTLRQYSYWLVENNPVYRQWVNDQVEQAMERVKISELTLEQSQAIKSGQFRLFAASSHYPGALESAVKEITTIFSDRFLTEFLWEAQRSRIIDSAEDTPEVWKQIDNFLTFEPDSHGQRRDEDSAQRARQTLVDAVQSAQMSVFRESDPGLKELTKGGQFFLNVLATAIKDFHPSQEIVTPEAFLQRRGNTAPDRGTTDSMTAAMEIAEENPEWYITSWQNNAVSHGLISDKLLFKDNLQEMRQALAERLVLMETTIIPEFKKFVPNEDHALLDQRNLIIKFANENHRLKLKLEILLEESGSTELNPAYKKVVDARVAEAMKNDQLEPLTIGASMKIPMGEFDPFALIAAKVAKRQNATAATNGGIDLNPMNMEMFVDDNGVPFEMTVDPELLRALDTAPGLAPAIINVVPLNPAAIPSLLGLKGPGTEGEEESLNEFAKAKSS